MFFSRRFLLEIPGSARRAVLRYGETRMLFDQKTQEKSMCVRKPSAFLRASH
jgi:hypothetical protein